MSEAEKPQQSHRWIRDGDGYGPMIKPIKPQEEDKSELGMGALLLISHVECLFRANELCHALAVEIGSIDFNTGNIGELLPRAYCSA